MTDTWRSLKPILRDGYPTVNLSRSGAKAARRIHRLVLEAFVGPCPEGMVACHNDGSRTNNDLTNLRFDSYRANSEDSLRHGTRARGSKCRATKLTDGEVLQIRQFREEGVSISELARRFGVTTTTVRAIVNRRSWKHLQG